METRTEFWRQQKPLYARKKEKGNVTRKKNKPSLAKFVLKQLEEVDQGKLIVREHRQIGIFPPRKAEATEAYIIHILDENLDC